MSNFSLLCGCSNITLPNNGTSDLWLVEDKVTGQVTAAFLLLILVVGLPLNLLAVITIVKEKLYHQFTIALLLNLAISDICILIFVIPFQIVIGFAGEFILGTSDGAANIYTIAIMALCTSISHFL